MPEQPCTHAWIGGFAARLIQLRPRTSVGSAVGCAVACFHDAAALPPARAVDIFLLTRATPPRRLPGLPAAVPSRVDLDPVAGSRGRVPAFG